MKKREKKRKKHGPGGQKRHGIDGTADFCGKKRHGKPATSIGKKGETRKKNRRKSKPGRKMQVSKRGRGGNQTAPREHPRRKARQSEARLKTRQQKSPRTQKNTPPQRQKREGVKKNCKCPKDTSPQSLREPQRSGKVAGKGRWGPSNPAEQNGGKGDPPMNSQSFERTEKGKTNSPPLLRMNRHRHGAGRAGGCRKGGETTVLNAKKKATTRKTTYQYWGEEGS